MIGIRSRVALVVVTCATAMVGSACALTQRSDADPLPVSAAVAEPVIEPARWAAGAPTPVLAYYYIWFNPTSWNRAKIDYPRLGRYDSDDPEIMRRHVVAAKDAGIDGFLVSWKHLKVLDDRLRTLISVARAEHFWLGIVYQGLDFERRPLPVDVVRTDLGFFADTFANDPVFGIFDRPVVVWTGNYHTPPEDIAAVTAGVRDRLMILSAARSVEDYEASAEHLDGEAYYWSSVDPRQPSSIRKLAGLAQAVRRRGGLWIAPAAPGYDGRPLGGTRVVDRRAGATLRESLELASLTQPDAIGLISWNEFSENTYVEPSDRYGERELEVLADFVGAQRRVRAPADSSEAVDRGHAGLTSWGALIVLVAGAALLPVVGRARTNRRRAAHVERLLRDVERRAPTRPPGG